MTVNSVTDLCIGDKIGRLTVLEIIPGTRKKGEKRVNRKVRCKCDCGNITESFYHHVKIGHTKSCGCLQGHDHGLRHTPEYNSWAGMIQRCYYKKHRAFNRYGGRGIMVCDKWKSSFTAFLNDMGKKPSPKHSLDRIDNNGNYQPENCRWSNHGQQIKNSTVSKLNSNIVLEIRRLHPRYSYSQLAKKFGVQPSNIGHIVMRRSWKNI